MLYLGLVCAAVVAAPLEVDLQTVAGESHHGALVSISADELALATADGERRWPLVDVLDIASAKAPRGAATPAVIVNLRDGSRVHAAAYTTSGDTATIELADGAKLSVPTRGVHWVRWPQSGAPPAAAEGKALAAEGKAPAAEGKVPAAEANTAAPAVKVAAPAGKAAPVADLGAQGWQQFIEQPIEADLLVVRKKEDVDSVDGQIGDVGAESVAFAIDDEKLDVKRSKIVGLVYYRAEEVAAPAPLAKVQTADGSAWAAKSLTLTETGCTLETATGAKVDVPSAALARIDFSQGKVLYLSDLDWDAAQSERTPYFGPPMPLDASIDPYVPQRDRALEGGELALGRRTYRKGLALHSRTRLVFRLPEGYRRLTALAGIDDRLSDQGSVKLDIMGDDKTLLSAIVSGGDAPLPLDLDVSGVRRLTIVVDFGNDQDVGDHLDLCELRIIK